MRTEHIKCIEEYRVETLLEALEEGYDPFPQQTIHRLFCAARENNDKELLVRCQEYRRKYSILGSPASEQNLPNKERGEEDYIKKWQRRPAEERFFHALGVTMADDKWKYNYDHAYILKAAQEREIMVFGGVEDYCSYVKQRIDIGCTPQNIGKYYLDIVGTIGSWTFSDLEKTKRRVKETTRRNNVAKRFLAAFYKGK